MKISLDAWNPSQLSTDEAKLTDNLLENVYLPKNYWILLPIGWDLLSGMVSPPFCFHNFVDLKLSFFNAVKCRE